MIGLDTNILLRTVLQDHPVEGLRARKSEADFADLLIALKNEAAGCSTTLIFDKPAC